MLTHSGTDARGAQAAEPLEVDFSEADQEILRLKDDVPNDAKPKAGGVSFKMTGSYQIQHPNPAATIGESVLINVCEIMLMVALPGVGKTQVCEVLACAYLASAYGLPDVDTYSIQVNAQPGRKVLLCDTERSLDDNYFSFDRIRRRINVDQHPQVYDTATGEFPLLDYRCFSQFGSAEEFKRELGLLIESEEYAFIIIDGILDFVATMNDEKEADQLVKWIRSMANRLNLAFACTIHPNKGSETVAGHLGAFMYRYCRACLLIRPHENDKAVKVLTSDFTNGKLSKGSRVETLFRWSDEHRMMISVEDEPAKANKDGKKAEYRKLFEGIFSQEGFTKGCCIKSADLRDYVVKAAKVTPRTAKDRIAEAKALDVLEVEGDARRDTKYRLADEAEGQES